MSAMDDPRYAALTAISMAEVGSTNPRIGKAMEAQRTCELGHNDVYPPARNNPGNIARDAANDIEADFTIGPNAPQPSNPIVTFATPEYGAWAYGKVLATLPRYAGVRGAIEFGDPYAFMKAIDASGYGGGYACMASVYREPWDDPPVEDIGLPWRGATGWVKAEPDPTLARLFKVRTSDGVLIPIPRPTPGSFAFEAYVSGKVQKRWAPGPGSTNIATTDFRKVLGPVHGNTYIRLSDMGTTFHEL